MKVLVIAPHADDEVLGMGGTIARYADEGKQVVVAVLTGHGNESHPIWTRDHWDEIRAECRHAADILDVSELHFRELPAACLDAVPAHEINKIVAELIEHVAPREVYVPFAHDLHQDHGALSYAVSVATRPYLSAARNISRVLAYETLSETHLSPPYLSPAFQPNCFINITNTIDKKIAAMKAYKSQIQQCTQPRSEAALRSLAHLRGTHIGTAAAEAFILLGEYCR